ncbi:Protein C25G6.1 [Aphelenchoides avenae]|nr:Protein C25G6.1 [Aphelenchus avenae]KAH7718354.1 Protein C25G6.1 [Aphelenchus avenae]
MYRFSVLALAAASLVVLVKESDAIVCAQCNGWDGNYPAWQSTVSTCDNKNNQCETSQFCVKMVDPVNPRAHYSTFKADCWYQNSITSHGNTTTIQSGKCYPYMDGSTPPKQYLYCFCSNRDYCNAAITSKTSAFLVLLAAVPFVATVHPSVVAFFN